MHENRTRFLIRLIAVGTTGTALYVLLPTYWKYWWEIIGFWVREGISPFARHASWLFPAMILFDLILLFKLVTAYGLFRLRSWAITPAICVLSLDFIFRLWGAINTWTYTLRHPEPPPIPTEGVVVKVISMWPSYIIGAISLVSLIILFRKSVREVCS